jgi:hypothetical protein
VKFKVVQGTCGGCGHRGEVGVLQKDTKAIAPDAPQLCVCCSRAASPHWDKWDWSPGSYERQALLKRIEEGT